MNTINDYTGRSRRQSGGFTLTEILVVIAIMAVLLAMLAPSVVSVFFAVRKNVCKGNLNSIIIGAKTYANEDARHRLPTVKPKKNNWGNMRDGNPGCLAVLISEKMTDRSLYLCPEARVTRHFEKMPADANTFTYYSTSANEGVSTLSYSYISMVYEPTWHDADHPDGNLAAKMTVDQVPGTLPVIADQNPRCTFGTQTLKSYQSLKDWEGDDLPVELIRNSKNHKNKGQNVARWDGSVKWITDANSPTNPEDDIYVSSATSGGTDGRRKEMADAFLIP